MPYLLIKDNFPAWKKRQLKNYHAVPIAESVWLSNTEVKEWDAVRVEIGEDQLHKFKDHVERQASKIISEVEEKIIQRKVRGVSGRFIKKSLKMIIELSVNVDTIAHASDLLFLLGSIYEPSKTTGKTSEPKDNPLGLDRKSVEKYLLDVAKGKAIH